MTSLTLRLPAASFRSGVRPLAMLGLMLGVLLATAVAGLLIGAKGILGPGELLEALLSSDGGSTAFAVRELRLPRVLAGILVGLALGMSGAIFQTVARNGLVSPDIVGVNSGASLAALVVIVLGTQARGAGDAQEVPLSMIAPAALGGALGAAVLVYLLGYVKGLNPYRLVLIGIGVTSVLSAGIAYALTLTRFPFATQLAFRWTVGSMYGTDWTEVTPALIAGAVTVGVAVAVMRPIGILSLGDDTAAGLGSPVERDRLGLIGIGVVLAAIAVSLAGPVGFVAFIAPHIARALLAASGSLLVVGAGLAGAILTVLADLVALRAVPDIDVPVGAVTALMGAPYFLFLLYRANRLGAGT